MAKLNSQTLTIKISKMVRDSDPEVELIDGELISQLEAVMIELAGGDVMVEVSIE